MNNQTGILLEKYIKLIQNNLGNQKNRDDTRKE